MRKKAKSGPDAIDKLSILGLKNAKRGSGLRLQIFNF